MEVLIEKTIGQMVAEDYRTAQVFKNHRIDFCCKGNRSIREVAERHNLNVDDLLQELVEVKAKTDNENIDFQSWPLDLLIDYIEKKHHRYVEAKIPTMKQYLAKLCRVHGDRHPELHKISEHFNQSAGELIIHMKKEELVLFPWARKMVQARQQGARLDRPHFGTVYNPIQMMMKEHDNEGERFRQIEALCQGYAPPADACNTYRVTYSLLQEFEKDLHQHIHLENNILFPKAHALESELGDSI